MRQYQGLVRNITVNGHTRGDRTGVGTQGIFGYLERFNLFNGTIPLLTTKKMHLRGIIHELLRFIAGDTSSNSLMQHGVKIWEPWALDEKHLMRTTEERLALIAKSRWASKQLQKHLEQTAEDIRPHDVKVQAWLDKTGMYAQRSANSLGDLGFVYGGPWRRLPTVDGEIIQVDRRVGPAAGPMEPPEYVRDSTQYKSAYSGDLPTRWQNGDNPFELIADVGSPTSIAIRFIKTGAVKVVSRTSIINTMIVDSYAPKIYGVACMGVVRNARATPLFGMWMHILARCYDTDNSLYRNYGAKGAYVSPRWLCYENFYNDVKRLPNYERWAKDPMAFDLTKDYYASQCYDVTTCLFAPTAMRYTFGDRTRVFHTTSPKGIEKIFIGLRVMTKALGVETPEMDLYLEEKETPKKLRGWLIRELKAEEGKVYRQRLFIDQVDELIKGLKQKPFSRRHIVTAWIPEALPDERISPHANVVEGRQCLSACHCMFQFFVRDLGQEDRLMWYLDNGDAKRELQTQVDGHTTQERYVINFELGQAIESEDGFSVTLNDTSEDALANFLEAKGVPTRGVSCMLIQRSSDVPIGVPYNWASYAIFTRMVAQCVGMAADEFVWVSGDTHIYLSQLEGDGLKSQLDREPFALPKLKINPAVQKLEDFKVNDFKLIDYQHHAAVRYPVEV